MSLLLRSGVIVPHIFEQPIQRRKISAYPVLLDLHASKHPSLPSIDFHDPSLTMSLIFLLLVVSSLRHRPFRLVYHLLHFIRTIRAVYRSRAHDGTVPTGTEGPRLGRHQ